MTTKKTLRLLKKMGDLMQQLANIKETLGKSEFFEELSSWGVVCIYYNCKIENGKLFTNKGELLSGDGRCIAMISRVLVAEVEMRNRLIDLLQDNGYLDVLNEEHWLTAAEQLIARGVIVLPPSERSGNER